MLQAANAGGAIGDSATDLRQQAAAVFAPLRQPDGGYAKNTRNRASSTYHTFLVVSCKQWLGIADDDPPAIASFLCSRQRPDGGFVEVADARSSGVNPTAAAIVLARAIEALTSAPGEASPSGQKLLLPSLEAAARYLAAMQTPEGGLRASALVPFADLLSTFTGLVALTSLEAVWQIDRHAMQRYVAGLEDPAGGYRGGLWDAQPDCEYTFYGLGTLALLHSAG
jgi:geranylgeranyl transferase type-2 subunit beta